MQVVFLILPHTNLLDLGGASQVFYEAKDQGLELELSFCSIETKISTSVGINIANLTHYKKQQLFPGDYLIVLSADYHYIFSSNFNPASSLLTWLSEAYQQGVNICGICTGAFLLGKAGLLDDIKCTTHWKRTNELQLYFPKAKVQQNIIFIEDKGIYTSAGANSAIDISLHILTAMKNDYFSHKVARELVVYHRRNGLDEQQSNYINYRNHIHVGIHKVQDYLQNNLHKKNMLVDLAEMANMSSRNFCRIFKKETSLTVVAYINALRKERINELLKNPDLSRGQIAKQCGLVSERQVSRLLKA